MHENRLADFLASRCLAELACLSTSGSPLIDLICFSLGPGARWAGLAEDRSPFGSQPGVSALAPFRRWWYAPWCLEEPGDLDEDRRRSLREIAAFAAILVSTCGHGGDPRLEVERWTGVVSLDGTHSLLSHGVIPGSRANLLPIPWPWKVDRGLRSEALRTELRDRFSWGPGRTPAHLARAPLFVVPLPAPREVLFDELRVGGVTAGVLLPPTRDRGQRRKNASWWEVSKWLL